MPSKYMVQCSCLGLALSAALVWCAPSAAEEGTPSRVATLELALPEVNAEPDAQAFIASDDTIRELLVVESNGAVVRRLTDSMAWWGKPLSLRDAGGAPAVLQGFHFDQEGGVLGVASSSGVRLFKSDGTTICSNERLKPALDIAGLRSDLWAVSLIRRGGRELAGAGVSVEDGTPRVVVIDQRCRVVAEGLTTSASHDISTSAVVGRVLRLTADERWYYAVESANYRVFQLDRKLKPHGQLVDPALVLEDGWSQGAGEMDEALITARATEHEGEIGRTRLPADPSRPQVDTEGSPPTTVTLHWVPVVSDVEWDPVESRLLLLLSDQVSDRVGVLDLLDLTTGEVERFPLELCEGCPNLPIPLSRLAVTKGYVWVSTARASGPVYRLDRSQLRGGERFRLIDELVPPDPNEEMAGATAPAPAVPSPQGTQRK